MGTKISELTELSSGDLTDTDLFVVVDDIGGTATTKKTTLASIKTAVEGGLSYLPLSGGSLTGSVTLGDNSNSNLAFFDGTTNVHIIGTNGTFVTTLPGGFSPTSAVWTIYASDTTTTLFSIDGNGSLIATNHVEGIGFDVDCTSAAQVIWRRRPLPTNGPLIGWKIYTSTSSAVDIKVSKVETDGTTTELFTASHTTGLFSSGTVNYTLGEDDALKVEILAGATAIEVSFGVWQKRGA